MILATAPWADIGTDWRTVPAASSVYSIPFRKQQTLYLLPLPHGHGEFRESGLRVMVVVP